VNCVFLMIVLVRLVLRKCLFLKVLLDSRVFFICLILVGVVMWVGMIVIL